jgi:hypothetical protein
MSWPRRPQTLLQPQHRLEWSGRKHEQPGPFRGKVLAKGKEPACSGTRWNAQNAWLRQEPEAVDAAVVAAAPDFASSGVALRAKRISRATIAANPTYANIPYTALSPRTL